MRAALVAGVLLVGTAPTASGARAASVPSLVRAFTASADSSVNAAAARQRYGARGRLELRARPARRAYLRFRVAGLSGPVSRATLRMWALRSSRSGYRVHTVTSATWPATGLTFRQAPGVGARLATTGAFARHKWVAVDVTRAVRGNGTVTLALTTRSARLILLASREGGPRRAPRLFVTVAAPASDAGAHGPAPAAVDPSPSPDPAPEAPPPPPTALESPRLEGRAWEKQTLTTTAGGWRRASGDFSYQWQRCDKRGEECRDLSGATDSSYTLSAKDVGSTVRVAVTATNPGGESVATSEPSTVVIPAPVVPSAKENPSIEGRPQEGLALSLRLGAWKGTGPIELSYQWQRCDDKGGRCVDVAGATAARYGLMSADLGSTMRAVVTATNIAGSTVQPTKSSSTVTPPPPPPSVGVVGLWHMDELSGTTMFDSSGKGNNGKLKDVGLGQPGFSGYSYYFNGKSAVVTVPSAESLNPGVRDFSWGLRLLFTSKPSGSVDTWDPMRKGYSHTEGGDFKMEIFPSGEPTCYAQGEFGSARVTGNRDIADGLWHTLVCSRRAGSLRLEVDGRSFSSSANLGAITNTAPLMVGARTTGMEFFQGFIDEAHMTIE